MKYDPVPHERYFSLVLKPDADSDQQDSLNLE